MTWGKRQDPTVTLRVVVENLRVVHEDEAEVRVVTLLRDVAGGQTGVDRRPRHAAALFGSLGRLNESSQIHSFT